MKLRLTFALALFAAAFAAPAAAQDRILASARPPATACPAGGPLQVWLLQQSSATDCDNTVSGTTDALCCCINNSWGACASAGTGGNSFQTIDLPSGTDPVADSSADTLTVTCSGPLTCTGNSGSDSWALAWSGTFADAQIDGSLESDEVVPTLAGDVDGPSNSNDLDEAAVEFELESVLDLQDLQGAVTDAQVPNTITVDLAAAATALAANGGNCAAGKSARGVDASGAAENCDDTAPYGLVDPLKPPASGGTGGCIETFANGSEVCSWSWANQDSATITLNQGGASLVGDTTNELHVRAIAAATNADQTFTVRINNWYDGSSVNNDMCGAIVVSGGSLASPSEVSFTEVGDLATDGFYFMSDTNYDPAAGTTTNASVSWDLTTLRGIYVCHQLRYTDSTRALGMWYSTGPECTDWAQLGSNITLTADPLYWGFFVRRDGPCRVRRAQLRTDSNRNVWGD